MLSYHSPLYLPILIVLCCLEVILAFSSVGYIVLDKFDIAITFMHVPVIVGAMLFGPAAGGLLGGIFGFTSIWQATVMQTEGNIIFSPLFSSDPFGSFVLALGTRVLFGLIAGYLFYGLYRRFGYSKGKICLTACVAEFIHAFLVYAAIQCFFPETGYTITQSFVRLYSWNVLFSYIILMSIILLVHFVMSARWLKHMAAELHSGKKESKEERLMCIYVPFILCMFLMSLGIWSYFYSRLERIMTYTFGAIPQSLLDQFNQFSTQFFVALLALFIIMMVIFSITQRYILLMRQQANRDMMTGLYNKVTMTRMVNEFFSKNVFGYLIIIDVDDFKHINDTYGHPFGDKVLIMIASSLRKFFGTKSYIGRLGGDEFCVYAPLPEYKIRMILDEFVTYLSIYSEQENKEISCSMGICGREGYRSFEQAYYCADKALYEAKRLGKNRYIFTYQMANETDADLMPYGFS